MKSLPGEPGNWLIPNQNATGPQRLLTLQRVLPGTATFISDQAVANLDWNASPKDTLAAKYYYQHDPSSSPYAYSNVPGFTEHMDAGSMVWSLNNVHTIAQVSVSRKRSLPPRKELQHQRPAFHPGAAGMSSASETISPLHNQRCHRRRL